MSDGTSAMQTAAPALQPATVHDPSGHGSATIAHLANRSTITRLKASSPLKLLTPRAGGPAACIVTSTYGGGLLSGDAIQLHLELQEQTRCLLTTQASTKIYPADGQAVSTQALHATIEPGAILLNLPDALVPFAGSCFRGHQQMDLSPGASLVSLDWFSAGRSACGERWAMELFQTGTEVYLAGRCIFRDVLRLEQADGPVAGPLRMGSVDCFATLLLIGPAVAAPAALLHDQIRQLSAGMHDDVLTAASVFGNADTAGTVIRLATRNGTESIARWLRRHLGFVVELGAGEFWFRKW